MKRAPLGKADFYFCACPRCGSTHILKPPSNPFATAACYDCRELGRQKFMTMKVRAALPGDIVNGRDERPPSAWPHAPWWQA
jgi:hypothetical protein